MPVSKDGLSEKYIRSRHDSSDLGKNTGEHGFQVLGVRILIV